jgi:hypothetical protein
MGVELRNTGRCPRDSSQVIQSQSQVHIINLCTRAQLMLLLLIHQDVRFFKVRAERFPKHALKLNVKEVPTFIIFSNGSESDRVNGANVAELTVKLHKKVSYKTCYSKFNVL